jgi:hypothetical protein
MERPIDPPPPFPFVVRNAYFAAMKAQYDAQNATLAETRTLVVAQDDQTAEIRNLKADLPDRKTLSEAFTPVVASLDRLNEVVGRFDRSEIDYVTALYAAVVETTGLIVANTRPGKWIIAAWEEAKLKQMSDRLSICDIGTLGSPEKGAQFQRFLRALAKNKDAGGGLAQKLSAEDLLRFIRLAGGVCDAIRLSSDTIADDAPPAATS